MKIFLTVFVVIFTSIVSLFVFVKYNQDVDLGYIYYEKETIEAEDIDQKFLKTEENLIENELPETKNTEDNNILSKEIEQIKEIILPIIPIIEEEPSVSFDFINTKTREALVNILCTTKSSGPIKPISGSGIVIGKNGVILTNAHIAQYFLLKDYHTENFVECVIRTDSPAEPKYHAKLLYIPSIWVEENAENLKIENPKGTGENDFAFLIITDNINSKKNLPEEFPFITHDIREINIKRDSNVLLAGYPAGFLGGIFIQKDLYISSTITKIQEVFTFKEFTLDVISIGGSIVAQSGVSGGAVVNENNKLIALISTSSEGETTDDRNLNAITLSHINRSLIENKNTTLQELISGNIQNKADEFNEKEAPQLTKLLEEVLD